MKKTTIAKSLLIAVTLPLLAGCVVYQQPGPPGPPPAQVEVVPAAPGPLAVWVWIPGGYEWRGGGWVWVGGRWAARPYPGAVWVRSGWAWHGHHRVWVQGYWR